MRAGLQIRFENHGHLIPKWREATTCRDYLEGGFTLSQEHIATFRRYADVARFRDGGGRDLVPPMIDAVVRQAIEGELAVTGLEFDVESDRWTAQSWRIRFASARMVAVQCFAEDGRVLTRQDVDHLEHVGEFSIRDAYFDGFRRQTQIASLHQAMRTDVLPPLVDAAVRYVGDTHLTVSGLAFEPLRHRWTAQSWRMCMSDDGGSPEA